MTDEIRPQTYPNDDGAPMCAHGYGYGHGCDDCMRRTYLATLGWRELPAVRLRPWEALHREQDFAALTVAGQRDELLAAVGLLVEFLETHATMRRALDERYPLMAEAVETMGRRYGPWSR